MSTEPLPELVNRDILLALQAAIHAGCDFSALNMKRTVETALAAHDLHAIVTAEREARVKAEGERDEVLQSAIDWQLIAKDADAFREAAEARVAALEAEVEGLKAKK